MPDYTKKFDSLISKLDYLVKKTYTGQQEPFHFCNICNKNVTFVKELYRKFGKCPLCGSLERHRHMAIHLWSMLPRLVGANILHFAPETCLRNILTEIPNNYYPAKFNPEDPQNIDIRCINFESDFFDLIVLNMILEHVDDDAKAIGEIWRVLKPGGIALITVPLLHNYHKANLRRTDGKWLMHLNELNPEHTYENKLAATPDDRFKAYGQKDHLRIYGMEDFIKMLQNGGFKVVVSKESDFPRDFAARLSIFEEVFIAEK